MTRNFFIYKTLNFPLTEYLFIWIWFHHEQFSLFFCFFVFNFSYEHFIIKLLAHKIFTRRSWDLLSKLTTKMTNILLLLNIIISYKYVMETYNLFLSKLAAFGRDFGITKEEQKLVVLFCRDYHNWGIRCWNMLEILFWS